MAQQMLSFVKIKQELVSDEESEDFCSQPFTTANNNNQEFLLPVPNPYMPRTFKPIRPYLTAPTTTRRKKNQNSAPSPPPHATASPEFRFYDGPGPFQGDVVLEEDLMRKSERSLLPRETKKDGNNNEEQGGKEEEGEPAAGPAGRTLRSSSTLNPATSAANGNEAAEKTEPNPDETVGDVAGGNNNNDCNINNEGNDQIDNNTEVPPKPVQAPHPYPTEKNRLTIIYSYAHHGSTSVFANFMKVLGEDYPDRYIRYIDLRRASKILEKTPRSSWTLTKLIIAYFGITEQAEIIRIHRFFFDSDRMRDEDGKRRRTINSSCLMMMDVPVAAYIFLDELDEMQPDTLDTMLHILRKINWKRSSARVFLSVRTHLKARIDHTVISWLARGDNWNVNDETLDCYEMLPLDSREQIHFLYQYWRSTNFVVQQAAGHSEEGYVPLSQTLELFSEGLYNQLESLFPCFYKTLGACPFHLLFVGSYFTQDLSKYLGANRHLKRYKLIHISATKFIHAFIQKKFEYFLSNQIKWRNETLKMSDAEGNDMYRKLSRIHTKLAISTHDQKYVAESHLVRQFLGGQLDEEQELYMMGLVHEINGEAKFLHKAIVQFILAQYFVDFGRQKNTSILYISFLFDVILFAEECTPIRKFFDEYMALQQDQGKMKESIAWQRLRQFLIQHYFLDDERNLRKKEKPSSSSAGRRKDPHLASSSSSAASGCRSSDNSRDVFWERRCDSSASECDDAAPPTPGNQYHRHRQMSSVDFEGPLGYTHIKNNGSVLHLAILEGNMKMAHMLIDTFKGSSEHLRKFITISVPLEVAERNFLQPDSHTRDKRILRYPDLQVTTLHLLAAFGKGLRSLENLVQTILTTLKPEEIRASFQDNSWTAFHFAAMSSNWEFFEAVFSAINKKKPKLRLDINVKSPSGVTPLLCVLYRVSWFYTAVITDHPHSKPEDSNANNNESDDPMSPPPAKKQKATNSKKCSAEQSQLSVGDLFRHSKKIPKFDAVIKRFYVTDLYPDEEKNDPCKRHKKTIEVLLENGANINDREPSLGHTVLHQAYPLETRTMFQYLIEKGADTGVAGPKGRTRSSN